MSNEDPVIVDGPKPAAQLPERTPLPDIADIIFLLLVFLMLNLLPNFVLGDGSTGWHLATGNWILNHHSIPTTDFLSASVHKGWVAYQWLFDVIAAALARVGGMKLIAVATACAISWLFALVYLDCRRSGCHVLLALLLTILGALTSSIHWLARPHIFNFYGVFLLARHLEKYRTGVDSKKRFLLTTTIIMVLWSNLHPAFLFGFALIIIYMISEFCIWLFTARELRAASQARLITFATALVTAGAASLVNPNATRMYGYIFRYLGQSTVLANTEEFLPPNLHQFHAVCMLLILFAFVAALAGARRSLGLAPILTFLAFTYLALTSMRNEPLFVVVAVPIVCTLFASFSLRKALGGKPFAPASWLTSFLERVRPTVENVDVVERTCTMHLLPIATTGLLVVSCFFGGKFGPIEIVTSDWDPKNKPTDTLKCVEKNKLDWRNGLNLDNWGGYIFYNTGHQTFIDDRADYYGSDFYLDYAKMIQPAPDYKKVMDKHQIKWILMPLKSSSVAAFKAAPADWKVLCEDKAATLMVRTPAP